MKIFKGVFFSCTVFLGIFLINLCILSVSKADNFSSREGEANKQILIAQADLSTEAEKEAKIKEHYQQGLSLMGESDWLKAMKEFDKVLGLDPNNREAMDKRVEASKASKQARIKLHYDLALSFEGKSLWKAAIQEFDIVLEMDPDNQEAKNKKKEINIIIEQERINKYYESGLSLMQKSRWDEAIEAFDKVLKLDVDNQEAKDKKEEVYTAIKNEKINEHYTLGLSLMKEWQVGKAVKEFDKILALDPNNQKAKSKKGEIYRIIKKNEINQYYTSGLSLMKESKWDEAIEAFEEILKLDPDNQETKSKKEEAYKTLKKEKITQYYESGLLLMGEARWEEAIQEFNMVLTLDPDHAGILSMKEETYYKGAVDYLNKGERRKSSEYLEKVLEINPAHPEVNKLKSEINALDGIDLYNQKQWKEALSAFKKAIELDEGNLKAKKYHTKTRLAAKMGIIIVAAIILIGIVIVLIIVIISKKRKIKQKETKTEKETPTDNEEE